MRFLETLCKYIMADIDGRVATLEQKHKECELQHENHNRRHDDAAKNNQRQTEILTEIQKLLASFEPTIKRSAGNYTTFDTLLRWAGGGTVIIGLLSAMLALGLAIKGML